MKVISFILFILFFNKTFSYAKEISLDLKFLPKETVLPVVKDKVFTKNKNILLDGKLSVILGAGFLLTEALFNSTSLSSSMHYNFTEAHALSLNFVYKISGLSDSGQSLVNNSGGTAFALDQAPYIQAFYYTLYKYTAYYGKISLSHDWVMNLTTSFNFGGGVVKYSDANFPLTVVSADQSFYFNSNLAMNFDLGFLIYQGPDLFCPDKRNCQQGDGINGGGSVPILSKNLQKVWYGHTYLKMGLVYLF